MPRAVQNARRNLSQPRGLRGSKKDPVFDRFLQSVADIAAADRSSPPVEFSRTTVTQSPATSNAMDVEQDQTSEGASNSVAELDGNQDNKSQSGSFSSDKGEANPPSDDQDPTSTAATDPVSEIDGNPDKNSQPVSASSTDKAESTSPSDEVTIPPPDDQDPTSAAATDPVSEIDGNPDKNSQPVSASTTDKAESTSPSNKVTGKIASDQNSPPVLLGLAGLADVAEKSQSIVSGDSKGTDDDNSKPVGAGDGTRSHVEGSDSVDDGSARRCGEDVSCSDPDLVAHDPPPTVSVSPKIASFCNELRQHNSDASTKHIMFTKDLFDVVDPPNDTVGLCFLGKQTIGETSKRRFVLVHHSIKHTFKDPKLKKKGRHEITKKKEKFQECINTFFMSTFDGDNEGALDEYLKNDNMHLLMLCARADDDDNPVDFEEGLMAVALYRCFHKKCVAIDFIKVAEETEYGPASRRGVCPFLLGIIQCICRNITESMSIVLHCQKYLRRYYMDALQFRDITDTFLQERQFHPVSRHWNWTELSEQNPGESVVLQNTSYIPSRSRRIVLELSHSSNIYKKQCDAILNDETVWSTSPTDSPKWMLNAVSDAMDTLYEEYTPRLTDDHMSNFNLSLCKRGFPWLYLGEHIISSYNDHIPPRHNPTRSCFEVKALQTLTVSFHTYVEEQDTDAYYPVPNDEYIDHRNHRSKLHELAMRAQVNPNYETDDYDGDEYSTDDEDYDAEFLLNPEYYRRPRSDSDEDMGNDPHIHKKYQGPMAVVEVHVGCSFCKGKLVVTPHYARDNGRVLFDVITTKFYNHIQNCPAVELSVPIDSAVEEGFGACCKPFKPQLYNTFVEAARKDKVAYTELQKAGSPVDAFFDFSLRHVANWCRFAFYLHWYETCRYVRRNRYEKFAHDVWGTRVEEMEEVEVIEAESQPHREIRTTSAREDGDEKQSPTSQKRPPKKRPPSSAREDGDEKQSPTSQKRPAKKRQPSSAREDGDEKQSPTSKKRPPKKRPPSSAKGGEDEPKSPVRRSGRRRTSGYAEREEYLQMKMHGKDAKALEGMLSKSRPRTLKKRGAHSISDSVTEAEERNRTNAKKKYDDAMCLKRVKFWEFVVPTKRKPTDPKLPRDSRIHGEGQNHVFGWFGDLKNGRTFHPDFFVQKKSQDAFSVPINKKRVEQLRSTPSYANRRLPLTSKQKKELNEYADKIIHDGQIYKLRALTEKEIQQHPRADDNEEDEDRPPFFLGFVTNTNKQKYLSLEWARWNFQPRYPKLYTKLQMLPTTRFYKLKDGTVLDKSGIQLPCYGPPVSYLQGENDTCVFCSVASALDYIGDHAMRDYIADYIELSVTENRIEEDPVEFVGQLLRGELRGVCPPKTSMKFYRQCGKRLRGESTKVFQIKNCVDDNLTICSFDNHHTVSITNGWIFDSNHLCALPVDDLECINWCLGNSPEEVVNLPHDLSTVVKLVYRFAVPEQVINRKDYRVEC